ncbi:MAG: hypothetical protein K2M46_05145 [Lachnospiraceae bacterium]|nr:hypothetical protein [Lachnospiraceae bacterium]
MIDKSKLQDVMEIIENAAAIMEERGITDEVVQFEKMLRQITGKETLQITDFREYWGWTSLEEIARMALNPTPPKEDVSDKEIGEIVLHILEHSESEMEYWLDYLAVNTGIKDISDYIFYPDKVGLNSNAGLPEIAEKIIMDRKR